MRRSGNRRHGDADWFVGVSGTPGDDLFQGTDQGDGFSGDAGNDMIFGNGGDDSLDGGTGNDLVDGGDDNDYVRGGDGDDVVRGGSGNDRVDGGTGIDRLRGGLGDDILSVDGGGDRVDGGAGYDWLSVSYATATTALPFDDRIGGLPGVTYKRIEALGVAGTRLADTFYVTGAMRIAIAGGLGLDEATLDLSKAHRDPDAAKSIRIDYGNGSLSGTAHGDHRIDYREIDRLHVLGTRGTDFVAIRYDGVPLHDRLDIDAGAGIDTLSIKLKGQTSCTFVINDDGSISSDIGRFSNFEGFSFILGGGKNHIELGGRDDIVVTDRGGDNFIATGGGNDIIRLGEGGPSIVDGGAGDDTIDGRHGRYRTLDGGAGDDHITLGSKNMKDVHLHGGNGYDILTSSVHVAGRTIFDDSADQVIRGLDIDGFERYELYTFEITTRFSKIDDLKIVASRIHVHFDGSSLGEAITAQINDSNTLLFRIGDHMEVSSSDQTGDLNVTGTRFDDTFNWSVLNLPGLTLDGGDGLDTLAIAIGTNMVVTGDTIAIGTFTYSVSHFERYEVTTFQSQFIVLGDSDDVIESRSTASSDRSSFSGGGGDDLIVSSVGRDLLDGGTGADVLQGGASADALTGGLGVDSLAGGSGADRFVFTSTGDSRPNHPDAIVDFSGAAKDLIDLSAIDTDTNVAGDQAFVFIGAASFSGGPDAELRLEQQSDGRYLVQGDVDHDGVADMAILVASANPLQSADFVL